MKTKNIMSVLVIGLGLFVASLGQSVVQAQELPIRSQDQLRQYAFKQCVNGSRSVSSDSIDWNSPSNVTYFSANGTFGEEILDSVFAANIQYAIINTNDIVRAYSYLYDSDRNTLFFGYNEYPIDSSPKFGLWLQDVPLPLTNVSWAEILVLNADGRTADRIQLQVRNGRPIMPPWLAGAPNGTLVTWRNDGTTLSYDLWSPTPNAPDTSVEKKTGYKVDSHFIGRFNATNDATVKIIETYNRPSAYIELMSSRLVTFDVLGLYYDEKGGGALFERPQSLILEDQATGVSYTIPTPGTGVYAMTLPIGKFRVIWVWEKFGKPNFIYWGGGGKG